MRDEKAFEQAILEAQKAVNYKGLKILLLPPPPYPAQAFVNRIHEITNGIPIDYGADDGEGHMIMPAGLPEQYDNLADNIMLLAKCLKASVRGLKK